MTVLVGYLAGKCGPAPLHLAVQAARVLRQPLVVVTVVPKPWSTPSPARVDAEFSAYATKLAEESETRAREHLADITAGIDLSFRYLANRTVGDGLLEAVADTGAEMLVVGSSNDGALGQVVLGSTTDWLLHASPVPVALTPRGYRNARGVGLTRITCAYSGTPEAEAAVNRIASWSQKLDVPMRLVAFAIRGRTMFPPLVGLHSEDSLLAEWSEQLGLMIDRLRERRVIGPEVESMVVQGNGWGEALDAVDWADGDLLAVGTSTRRGFKGVFLGSHGAKIIRHSPVPVLVLPA